MGLRDMLLDPWGKHKAKPSSEELISAPPSPGNAGILAYNVRHYDRVLNPVMDPAALGYSDRHFKRQRWLNRESISAQLIIAAGIPQELFWGPVPPREQWQLLNYTVHSSGNENLTVVLFAGSSGPGSPANYGEARDFPSSNGTPVPNNNDANQVPIGQGQFYRLILTNGPVNGDVVTGVITYDRFITEMVPFVAAEGNNAPTV